MANALSPTSFVTGAKDQLATADVYKKADDSVVNDIKNVLVQASPSIVYALRGGASAKSLLPGLGGNIANNLSNTLLNKATSLLGNANAISDTANKTLKALTPLASALVAGKVSQVLGNKVGSLSSLVSINGITSRVLPAVFPDARSLSSAVAEFTNTRNPAAFTNTNALVGMAAGLVTSGMSTGLPGVFSNVKSQLTSPAMVSAVVKSCLPDVISKSSLSTLKEFAQEKGLVKQLNSSVIEDFSKNFASAIPLTNAEKIATFVDAKDTFTTIDPSWASVTRITEAGPDPAINLSAVMGSSAEFKNAVIAGASWSPDPNDKFFLVADAIPKTTPDEELKKNFPIAASAVIENPAAKPVSALAPETPKFKALGDYQWNLWKNFFVDDVDPKYGAIKIIILVYLDSTETLVREEYTKKVSDTDKTVHKYTAHYPKNEYRLPY